MRYKVGDRVRVKSLERLKTEYTYDYIRGSIDWDNYMNSDMVDNCCGKLVTISDIDDSNTDYKIEEHTGYWRDWMFDEEETTLDMKLRDL